MPTTSKELLGIAMNKLYATSPAVLSDLPKEELDVMVEEHLEKHWPDVIDREATSMPGKWKVSRDKEQKFVQSKEMGKLAESFLKRHAGKLVDVHVDKKRQSSKGKAVKENPEL